MSDQPVRVRFAPSPTGNLHIGGARTALYNWAFARAHAGSLILRIEDTDPERSQAAHTQQILDALRWLGLNWDEGPEVGGDFGPYMQSQRQDIYRRELERLKQQEAVYPCFCTPEQREMQRREALTAHRPAGYDRRCRQIPAQQARERLAGGEAHTWRLKLPLMPRTLSFEDAVFGVVEVSTEQLDDFILVRSDGSPTYNFVACVDDALMRISHVIRGDDHLSNTPKQLLLYEALGYTPPRFAHLSMILGSDGRRLSKRQGATAVQSYRHLGVLPAALLNYLALLGWSLDDHTTLFDAATLTQHFSLARISKNPAVFDPQKLLWMNQAYLKKLGAADFLAAWQPYLLFDGMWRGHLSAKQAQIIISQDAERVQKGLFDGRPPLTASPTTIQDAICADIEAHTHWYHAVYPLISERIQLLAEANAKTAYLFCAGTVPFDEASVEKCLRPVGTKALLAAAEQLLTPTSLSWQHASLEEALRALSTTLDVKPRRLFQALRVAVCGNMVSPPLFESLVLIGRSPTLERLRAAGDLAG